MLILSRRKHQSIVIGDSLIKIIILEVKGHQVKIGIDAPEGLPVHRQEIYERMKAQGETLEKRSKQKSVKDLNKKI